MKQILRLACMAALLAGGSWLLRPPAAPALVESVRFEECAGALGIDHLHSLCRLSDRFSNIMPWLSSVGAAVAIADVDGDGRMDLYVTSSGRGDDNRLLRQRGDGTFEDITESSGTGVGNRAGASMAAVFGDVDNDGDPDLYVLLWGATNVLFENLGGGRFRDVTSEAGVGWWGYGNGATFLDYDRDGRLDLLVGNYFAEEVRDPQSSAMVRNDLWNPVTTKVMHESFTHARNGGRNVLYRNVGGLRFEDVTEQAGLGYRGWTLAVGASDLDNDGWPDLYLANDFGPDEVYFNTGASERPPRFRPFVGSQGRPAIGDDWWKGMNVEFGDVDGNGYQDVYVTNILAPRYKTDEGNMLWLNLEDPAASSGRREDPAASSGRRDDRSAPGGRRFVNVGRKTGTHDGGWGWGAKIADFDNDGRPDIFAVNGFVTGADSSRTYWYELQEMVTQLKNVTSDAADWPVMGDRDLSGREASRLWLQRAPGRDGSLVFQEAAVQTGITDLLNGRGVGLLDADDDGDVDIFIANQGQPACYYRNLLYDGAHRPGESSGSTAKRGSANGHDAKRADASNETSQSDVASTGRSAGENLSGAPDDGASTSEPRPRPHWLGLALTGDTAASDPNEPATAAAAAGGGRSDTTLRSTRDAVGARVVVLAGGRTLVREVSGGVGFAGQSDPRLFFGLGESAAPESIEIHWPSGRVQRIEADEARRLADRMTRVVEGRPIESNPDASR